MCWIFTPYNKIELSYNGKEKFGEVELKSSQMAVLENSLVRKS